MSLVLAVVILGVAEVVILSLAFRAFERSEERRARAGLLDPVRRESSPGRFFADAPGASLSERAPLEALLLELEHHARLERAAAESFLRNPTPEALHHRARNPLHLAN